MRWLHMNAFLWLFLLIPAVIFYYWDQKMRSFLLTRFASHAALKKIIPEQKQFSRARANLWSALGFIFLVIALAQPQWGFKEELIQTMGLDIMVVFDASLSMNATDIAPSRIEKSKHFLKRIIGDLVGDRVGLVTFAQSSAIACPLTTNIDYFKSMVEGLSTQHIKDQGTNIGNALETAEKALKRGSQETFREGDPTAQSFELKKASRILLLITDGEDHEDQALEIAQRIGEEGIKLMVFGVGTAKGSTIPLEDERGQKIGFKRDAKGQVVVSKFQGDFLKKIAQSANGKYFQISANEQEGQEFLKEIGVSDRTAIQTKKYRIYTERFQIFLGISLLCFLISLIGKQRRTLVVAMVGVFFFMTSTSFAESSSIEVFEKNQKGINLFKEGKFDDAERSFGEAQAKDPKKIELQFNQGVAALGKKDFDLAEKLFDESLKASTNGQNPGLAARSLYNLAQTFQEKKDLQKAFDAYSKSIQLAQQAQLPELEKSARKNLELLHQIKPPPPPPPKSSQKKEEESNEPKNSQEPEKDSKSQDPKEKKEGQRYSETPDSQRKKNYHSEKLSREDAEQVLSQLMDREKELKERLQQKNAVSSRNTQDW